MNITSQMVKELRDKTNAGMMDCKKALSETAGYLEKAVDLLRQKGLAVAAKRAGRETKEGVVVSYIHAGDVSYSQPRETYYLSAEVDHHERIRYGYRRFSPI